MKQTGSNYKPRKKFKPKYEKREEEPFNVDKWLKQHSNIEYPKRGKKNSLGDYKKGKRK